MDCWAKEPLTLYANEDARVHLCDLRLFVGTTIHVQSSGDTAGSEGGSVCVCGGGGRVGGAGGGAAARSVSLRLVLQGCVCVRVCDGLTET